LAEQTADARRIRLICGRPPDFLLDDGETVLGVFPLSTLSEPRVARLRHGTGAGPSVRGAKGVSLRFGIPNGTGGSHEELHAIDRGTLMLTDERLTFYGSYKMISVPLEKIIAVHADGDVVRLHRHGKQGPEYFQLNDGLSFTYEFARKRACARVHGQMVKAAIAQAVALRRAPNAA
jgi:hypothetical protein